MTTSPEGAGAVEHTPVKYAEVLGDWLVELGYTHCFFVAGGNIMHLLDAVRKRMTCIPVVHEVAAGIAAEYFNEVDGEGRAFALVTAGPGATNIMTAVGGAWLESRALLVIGGQVKTTDLATGGIRQRGIQEIDGLAIMRPVTVAAERLDAPIDQAAFAALVERSACPKKGPVFVEVCLDVQGMPVDSASLRRADRSAPAPLRRAAEGEIDEIRSMVAAAERPVILLGGGVSRRSAREALPRLRQLGVPVMTTWNGMDRVPASEGFYFGRPNTFGQRYSNILLQQADLVVALGTRLGLQQTGFNWQAFVPVGKILQVDIDEAELAKGHPHVELGVAADADDVLRNLLSMDFADARPWLSFCEKVKRLLPLDDPGNSTGPGYISPYRFMLELADQCDGDELVIPCSSGGAFTVTMQTFGQREGQVVVSNKGLASMGYGLSAAIGAALAHPGRHTVLLEGDGGFAQNLQELATVAVNDLPLKMFVFANEGYASIRMTQRNYFGGQYMGCDIQTGLGFPDWKLLFKAFGIDVLSIDPGDPFKADVRRALRDDRPWGFIVPIDPEQSYFPKISSRVTASGAMESQPLHLMTPDLLPDLARQVFAYVPSA